MTDRSNDARAIFTRAVSLAAGREEFLRQACGDDAQMLAEVRAMLDAEPGDYELLDDDATSVINMHEASRALAPGQLLGRFRLMEKIGQGGMGVIWRAVDTRLDRTVAIKFLSDAVLGDPQASLRLQREARSAGALEHPNICKVHEIGDSGGNSFVVMEHLTGRTLKEELKQGPLAPDRALEIAIEIAGAMEEAHAQSVMHRDLKPSNVMLTRLGHVKLMDFGLAKRLQGADGGDDATPEPTLTHSKMLLGTPAYMSPEQILGKHLDARSDLFSFGIVLYEMLAGTHPFQRPTPAATAGAILHEHPAPLSRHLGDAPEALSAVVDRLLAKDPLQRHGSFRDVRLDLHALKEGVTAGVMFPVTERVTRRAPLIGREAEIQELRRDLRRARDGHGTLVLLGGEPGVGKTRLAEEVLAEANRLGALCLTGRCYSRIEENQPFLPFVEAIEEAARIVPPAVFREALGEAAPEVGKLVPELRRSFPDMARPADLPASQQRRYLFNSVCDFFGRLGDVAPVVLLLDDLNWADEATMLLLGHVARRLTGLPILILGTYRDVEIDRSPAFNEGLAGLVRRRLARCPALDRLDEPEVARLLSTLGGRQAPESLVRVLYRHTEGNPFFIEEVFQQLLEENRLFDDDGRWKADLHAHDLDVPDGVRLVIGRRLARLGETTGRVLAAAAVAGAEFSLELLEPLCELQGDALLEVLEQAEQAHLITCVVSDGESRYAFVHELIRQTLIAGLSAIRRQRLHLRVAQAMERQEKDFVERHAAEIAHHLCQAGRAADPATTVRFLTLAGERAIAAVAFADATRHFDMALPLLAEDDRRTRAAILFKRGWTLRCTGRPKEAMADWQEALGIDEALGDVDAFARVCQSMVSLLLWGARHEQALVLADRGLSVVGDEPSKRRCGLLASAAMAQAGGGDYTGGLKRIEEAVTAAEPMGDPRLLGGLLRSESLAHWQYLRLSRSVAAGERAAESLLACGNSWKRAEVLGLTEFSLILLGELDRSERMGRELQPLNARLGNPLAMLVSSRARGFRDFLRSGDLGGLADWAGYDVKQCGNQANPWISHSLGWLALAEFWRGRWDDALAAMERSVESETPDGAWNGMAAGAWFLLRASMGDRKALELYSGAKVHSPRLGRANSIGSWMWCLAVVEGLAALDEQDAAAELYPAVVEAIDTGAVLSADFRLFQRIGGIAATAAREWNDAEQYFRTALRQADEMPHRVEQPETRRWYARMLLARDAPGDREKARSLLHEAAESYRDLGMPRHVGMAEQLANA